jgi:Flp pilus assembly protein TadG
MRRLRLRDDRGAAAVEFALVSIPLLMLLIGIVTYGQVFLRQNSLTNAARIGARTAAIEVAANRSTAIADAQSAAAAATVMPTVAASAVTISSVYWNGSAFTAFTPTSCTAPAAAGGGPIYMRATITASSTDLSYSSLLPVPSSLTGTAVMRCDG